MIEYLQNLIFLQLNLLMFNYNHYEYLRYFFFNYLIAFFNFAEIENYQ